MTSLICRRSSNPADRGIRRSSFTVQNVDAGHKKTFHHNVDDADTFVFNAEHMNPLLLPPDLIVELPERLIEEINVWQTAGAAVLTAMERIEALEEDSVNRGWPTKKMSHLSRQDSRESDSTLSSTAIMTPPSVKSNGCDGADPATHGVDGKHDQAKPSLALDRVDSRLRHANDGYPPEEDYAVFTSPVSLDNDDVDDEFDEAAWDFYIQNYKAELDHLKFEGLTRFRHLARSVDMVWNEVTYEVQQKSVAVNFVEWWSSMNALAKKWEKEAQGMKLPSPRRAGYERRIIKRLDSLKGQGAEDRPGAGVFEP